MTERKNGLHTLMCKRFNSETNSYDYFYPQQIHDPADEETAKLDGLEIGLARIGYRYYKAIFIPCKQVEVQFDGSEIYKDTSSEEQLERFRQLCHDEWNEQNAAKQDGRCDIPDGKGRTKRCPLRVKNPNYVPGENEPKTIPVCCEGCVFEQFKHAHSTVPMSSMDRINDDGMLESYEPESPEYYFAGDEYLMRRKVFLSIVALKEPNLTEITDLLTKEYSQTDISKELGLPISTVNSRRKRVGKLYNASRGDIFY